MKRSLDEKQDEDWMDGFRVGGMRDVETDNGKINDADDIDDEEEEEDWGQPSKVACPSTISPVRRSCQLWPGSFASGLGNETCLVSRFGHTRTIVHIDLDCFYAQVEMLRNPALRDKPLGIQQKNIVVTTNYVARARGVSKLSYIRDAVVKCPDLVLVSGEDLTNYRETSARVTELLEEFCPLVERLGFDENFMDVTKLVELRLASSPGKMPTHVGHSYGEDDEMSSDVTKCTCGCSARLVVGSRIAKEMRDALKSRLGLTSCAGIATNKLLAKLVGGHHKPNDQTVLHPEWTGHFMQTFTKVRQIPGIGHASGKKLAANGITTLQELRESPLSKLSALFGSQQAETMMRLAHGVDDAPVASKGLPQSLSDEDSFKKLGTLPAAKQTMSGLLTNLLTRLKADGRTPQTMRVTVRKFSPGSWQRESRQTTVSAAIFSKQDEEVILARLLDVAVDLLQKMVDTNTPFHLTLINICFTNMRSKVTKGSIDAFLCRGTSVRSQSSMATVDDGIHHTASLHNDESDTDATIATSTLGGGERLENENYGNNRFFHHPSSTKWANNNNSLLCQDKSPTLKHTNTHLPSVVSTTNENYTKFEKQKGQIRNPSSFFQKFAASHNITSPSKCGNLSLGVYEEKRIPPNDRSTETGESHRIPKSQLDGSTKGMEQNICMDLVGQHAELVASQSRVSNAGNVEQSSTTKLETGLSVTECDRTAMMCIKRASCAGSDSPHQTHEDEEVEMPPNVDRSVFDALPSNMRDELLAEWKRSKRRKEEESRRASSSKPSPRTLKSSSSKRKRQLTTSGNTIMKYFKH